MDQWLLAQDSLTVCIALFALLMGGAIGLPIPEDIPLIMAGIIIHRGHVGLAVAFSVCYVGILLGDILIFYVGRRFGPPLFRRRWVRNRFSPQRVVEIKRGLERRSLPMIFVARHLFYLRTLTFLTCGAFKMSFRRFLVADALAALVSVPLMLWLGHLGSENYEAVLAFMKKAKYLSLALGIVAISAYVLYRVRRARQAPSSPTEVDELAAAATLEQERPLEQ